MTPATDFAPPLIIPDGDTGHGDEHHIRNLVKKFIESKIGAIHIENQRSGCKVCGHQGQKVLVSTAEIISRLNMRLPVRRAGTYACPYIDAALKSNLTTTFARFETPSSPGYILIGIFACTENDNGLKDFGVF